MESLGETPEERRRIALLHKMHQMLKDKSPASVKAFMEIERALSDNTDVNQITVEDLIDGPPSGNIGNSGE